MFILLGELCEKLELFVEKSSSVWKLGGEGVV